MKKLFCALAVLFFMQFLLHVFSPAFPGSAAASEQKYTYPKCVFKIKFQTPIYVVFDDESSIGAKNLHCLALYLALAIDKPIHSIVVGDYHSKYIINADEAYWVIGKRMKGFGNKRHMAAFGRKLDAENFIKNKGGRLVTFNEALQAAFEDINMDLQQALDTRRGAKR